MKNKDLRDPGPQAFGFVSNSGAVLYVNIYIYLSICLSIYL